MTLYEVVHGVAFVQAFNFYLQERRLIPPGALSFEGGKIAFIEDLEAAQQYAQAQADLAWVRYQKFSPSYGWADEDTDTTTYQDHRGVSNNNSVPVPPPIPASRVRTESGTTSVPPPPPVPRMVRQDPHMKRTLRIPPVRQTNPRDWRNDEAPPPQGTLPYARVEK